MCVIYVCILYVYYICIYALSILYVFHTICVCHITYVFYIHIYNYMIIYAFVCTSIKYARKLFRALLKAICADFIATAQLFASQKLQSERVGDTNNGSKWIKMDG